LIFAQTEPLTKIGELRIKDSSGLGLKTRHRLPLD
jgi:hypothetical protein